jgi:SAM-dependent MidA family methyltransferase
MTSGSMMDLVRERVRREGPLRYSEVVELALYDPRHGFYAGHGGRAGRRGDFVTSVEVGPLFGAVVARALDRWWDDAGRPDPYVVVDVGAGPGTLARSIRAAGPRCDAALRLVLVERSADQRELHPDGVTSVADLPAGAHVIVANELLDNLPFDLAERTGDGWQEVRVGAGDDGALVEVLAPLPDPLPDPLLSALPDAPPGSRVPLQHAAGAWLAAALAAADRVVAFDYCASTTAELAARPWRDWLRTYRAHHRGTHPLDALGEQDVTCEVAVDQLALVRRPDADGVQADWLRAHGLADLVAEGRRVWAERAHLGDLAAVRARSRISEAEALTDPGGLGAHRVLEWVSRSGG